jgi:hypothetical protein
MIRIGSGVSVVKVHPGGRSAAHSAVAGVRNAEVTGVNGSNGGSRGGAESNDGGTVGGVLWGRVRSAL